MIKAVLVISAVVAIGLVVMNFLKSPSPPEGWVDIPMDRCDIEAYPGLTLTESKDRYEDFCGFTHPLYNCQPVGQTESDWHCWGFREGIEPTEQLFHELPFPVKPEE